jgi:hypothetical protein
LHTKTQIKKQILTFHPPRHHGRLFQSFESGEEQKDSQTLSEGFEWLAGSTEKLVSCCGTFWVAEEQIEMNADDWKASDDGYGCGGEGGRNGRFVSWLLVEIQPPKEMALDKKIIRIR